MMDHRPFCEPLQVFGPAEDANGETPLCRDRTAACIKCCAGAWQGQHKSRHRTAAGTASLCSVYGNDPIPQLGRIRTDPPPPGGRAGGREGGRFEVLRGAQHVAAALCQHALPGKGAREQPACSPSPSAPWPMFRLEEGPRLSAWAGCMVCMIRLFSGRVCCTGQD